ncbi:hypothetical protein EJF36_12665 [Bacillus sp. HMF5848]|uniref:SpoIIE family protein phosphatase n=1 Tax=Bacillus sp. HMF5848 TaxID=2495421 RepID=UPI000F7B7886|nr:SpoIIE family protein phosphatase [Bacillus sp. HMF5848]RSK27660.1 hypothetical protein EJF36_12665 [Bacillus sp. HMF5848]
MQKVQTPLYLQQILSFNKPIIDTMTRQVAILDHTGTIILTNKAWDMFTEKNGGTPSTCGVGVNYLEICKNSSAQEVYRELEKVLLGQSEEYTLEYPCPTDKQQRWFLMHVNPIEYKLDSGFFKGMIIQHIDITEKKEFEIKMKNELALAKSIQLDILPSEVNLDIIRISALYKPCKELSGDIYHWQKISDHQYVVAIFDIVSHGISASLLSMQTVSSFRSILEHTVELPLIVKQLNKHVDSLYKDNARTYFTALILLIDMESKTIEYINCGHPHGILINNQNDLQLLSDGTIPIGMLSNLPSVESYFVSYEPNSSIFLYTDGLMDHMSISKDYSTKKFTNWAKEGSFTRRNMEAYFQSTKHQEQTDDITMIFIDLF